jgi:hypothetical protein
MANDDTYSFVTAGGPPPRVDPGLDSNSEQTLDACEQLLDRAREISREVEDPTRRVLGQADPSPDPS